MVYTVLACMLVAFLSLPQTARLLKITAAQTDNAGYVFRFLLNVRYKIKAFFQFGKPLCSLKVDRIFVYPLKSCSYIEPDEWEIDEHGFKYDRQYMMAYWDGERKIYEPITLRNCPRMSLVKINYNLEENWFEFVYPIMDEEGNTSGHDSFRLPCEISEEFIEKNRIRSGEHETNLWDVHFQSFDIGKAVPDEFRLSMNMVRPGTTLLVSSKQKKVKGGHPARFLDSFRTSNFQDYYPMKFLAQEDIDLLNSKMKKQGHGRRVEALNFRPNMVVKGLQGDRTLDDWYRFQIETDSGLHQWSVAQKCPRCSIPNVKLEEGAFDKTNAATKTLTSYRKIDAGEPNYHFLGQYCIHHDEGYKISVGDTVSLLEEKNILYMGLLP